MDTASQHLLEEGLRALRGGHKNVAAEKFMAVVNADPNCEYAWMWLAQLLDADDRQTCLENIVSLNPNNRWAADRLNQLTSGIATGTDPFESETKPKGKVEAITCPSCAGSVKLQCTETVTVVCSYCSSVVDLSSEQAEVVQKNLSTKPSQPIEPGMPCTFEGIEFLCVGWMRFKGYDDEDSWRWEEWLLINQKDGNLRWLSWDDESGFALVEKQPIDTAFNPFQTSKIITRDGPVSIAERGDARILAILGELTWKANIGDTFHTLEGHKGKIGYSVEYTSDEMELFRETPLHEADVWEAFGKHELAGAVRAAQKAGKLNSSSFGRQSNLPVLLTSVALWLLFLLGILATGLSFISGKDTYTAQVPVVHGQEAKVDLPITITSKQPHAFTLQCDSFGTNKWLVAHLDLEDTQGNRYYIGGGEFWHESGIDWDESDYKTTFYAVPKQTGEMTLYVDAESSDGSNNRIRIKVKEGVVMTRYYCLFTIIVGLIMLVTGRFGTIDLDLDYDD